MKIKTNLYILFILIFLTPVVANGAQADKKKGEIDIFGSVYDSFTRGKVKAFMTIMKSDSTVIDTTTCYTSEGNSYSYYTLQIPRETGKYIIKSTAEGYEDKYTDYSVEKLARKRYIEMPEILMKRKFGGMEPSVELENVVVKGTRIQVAYRGDTIIYDASAFKLPEGSMLDALVRQLPGAELKDNGDIYINGKKIDYLTLNGNDFFKGENKVILENMPHFTVKNLKVYHKDTEKSRQLGKEVEEKDYVMDVTLKREYARSYIANAEVGAGTEERWMGRLFGMYYDDHTRVSTYFNANNVNEVRTPGSDGDWSPQKISQGVIEEKSAGLNLNTGDKKKTVRNNTMFKVSWRDSDNETKNFNETYTDNGSIFSNSMNNSTSKVSNITFYNSLNMEKAHLYAYTYLYYNNNKSWSENVDSTYSTSLTNRNTAIGIGRHKSLNIDQTFSWARPFESGDVLYLYLTGAYNMSDPAENFNNRKTYYAATGVTEKQNKYTDYHSSKYSYATGAEYLYPLPNNWELTGGLAYKQSYDDKHNEIFNLDRLANADYDNPGWLPSTHDDLMHAMDHHNSSTYDIMRRTYTGIVGLRYSTNNMYMTIRLPYYIENERMNYRSGQLDTLARRTLNSLSPSIYFNKRNTNTPLTVRYNLHVSPPSFESLMPVSNSSDPLLTTISNPDLANTVTQSIYGRIDFKNDSIGSNIYLMLNTNLTHNAIGNRATFNPATGAYTRMSDNVNGNWYTALSSGWQRPLDAKKRLRIDISGTAEYRRSVDFATATTQQGGGTGIVESPLSKVDNVTLNATAKLNYKLGDFTAGIIGKIKSLHTRGRLDIVRSVDANDIQYGANATYTIPVLKLTVATDINMYSRRGYESSMMNTDELVWNAQLTRSFFKGALTAKVQAYDILKKLNSKRYNVNAQGITETWFNYIPRYVMFSVAYKFTKKPKKGN